MTIPSTKVPTAREVAHALCLTRRPIPLCIDDPRLVEASGHSKACDFAMAAIEADREARDTTLRSAVEAELAEAVELLAGVNQYRYCGYDHASAKCPMTMPCWHHRRNAFVARALATRTGGNENE